MGFDAMANGASTAAAPRDIGKKKKRANRSAKLKQYKLDARRDQWLSQVKNKDSKVTIMAVSPTSHLLPTPFSLPRGRKGEDDSGRRPAEEEQEEQVFHDGSDWDSPTQSPTSSGSGRASRKGRPAKSIGSSCSFGSSSRTGSDTELEDGEDKDVDRGGENGPLDDWEAVADALSADNNRGSPSLDSSTVSAFKPNAVNGLAKGHSDQAPAKPEPVRPAPRAWRPDDAARPRSLPSPSKPQNFMVYMERQCGLSHPCGVYSSPSTCPICCEVLDVTDASFLPCSCGFRLCLFCYNRIFEEDGRCPGCRKQYSPTASGAMDVGGGGRDSLRLSHSCSMNLRS